MTRGPSPVKIELNALTTRNMNGVNVTPLLIEFKKFIASISSELGLDSGRTWFKRKLSNENVSLVAANVTTSDYQGGIDDTGNIGGFAADNGTTGGTGLGIGGSISGGAGAGIGGRLGIGVGPIGAGVEGGVGVGIGAGIRAGVGAGGMGGAGGSGGGLSGGVGTGLGGGSTGGGFGGGWP
uniref:Glycine-rich cell wall structural protein 1-like n=1 Tax=Nicotiana tabacum TaxID=4097 RepID=A0A1S3YT06_TOBAC|nr:PREDICTED: glycine-rich cell wall structural protein 1-like [Nicotiana tabacum]